MSRVIEGLVCSSPAQYKGDVNKFLKLWIHELKRVFSDRLTEMGDCNELDKILDEAFKGFEDAEKDQVFTDPLICTNFMSYAAGGEKT
jgi:hypothetical protein